MQLDLPHVLMPGSLLHGSTLQCRLASRNFSLRAPPAVLRSLTDFDGTLTPRQWLNACGKRGWDLSDATGLLFTLIAEGVIVSITELPRQIWSHVLNPRSLGDAPGPAHVQELVADAQARLKRPPDRNALTLESAPRAGEIHRLLRKRSSSRHFADKQIASQTLTAILWAAAGIIDGDDRLRAVVPSAGALYPLRHYYLNLRKTGALESGAFALSASDNGRLHYSPLNSDLRNLQAAFSCPDVLMHAQGVLVIAAEFSASASKYGPRALSYVPLEAGHAAQNALLAAAACDCHAVEIGGFLERDLAVMLSVGDSVVPITTVVLGAAAAPRMEEDTGEFDWVDAKDADGERPFFLCRARHLPTHPWSWGRDAEPAQARLKALMESRERAALCRPQGLVNARYADLTGAVHPEKILCYTTAQYRRTDFLYRPFDPRMEYWWKSAHSVLDDTSCFMLADLVYLEEGLAHLNRSLPYTGANTSGTASHTSIEAALESAVLELIERDAFMRVWLGGASCEVNEDELPASMRARLQRLRNAGVRVALRDIGHAYCPVAFCHGQSESRHFTRVSSCANYDFVYAMNHALMELEAQVYITLHNPPPAPIHPKQVREAADHAMLYGQKSHFKKADHLLASFPLRPPPRRLSKDWPDLVRCLREDGQQLIVVDLSDGAPLRTPTVKAFIPGLIPIKFGAGNEAAGHPAYRHLRRLRARSTRDRCLPHPFN